MSTLPSIISYIPGIVFNLHFVCLHFSIICDFFILSMLAIASIISSIFSFSTISFI